MNNKILVKAIGHKDISKLIPKIIIDRNGKRMKVWIKADQLSGLKPSTWRMAESVLKEAFYVTDLLTRKAVDLDQVRTIKIETEDQQMAIDSIPHYSNKDIGLDPNELLGDFSIKTPRWFVVSIKGKDYLVDTEGYNYPRYIGRIKY